MKILQKLKFMFARKDTPTEVRPDDMTSKKGASGEAQDASCCEDHAEKKNEGCCDDHGCDCK